MSQITFTNEELNRIYGIMQAERARIEVKKFDQKCDCKVDWDGKLKEVDKIIKKLFEALNPRANSIDTSTAAVDIGYNATNGTSEACPELCGVNRVGTGCKGGML